MSYDSDVLARSGLDHYIPFSETTGTPTDHFGSLVLTANGSPTVGAASITVDTEASCSFTATDYWAFTSGAVVDNLDADFTCIFVAKLTDLTTTRILFSLNNIDANTSQWIGPYAEASGLLHLVAGGTDHATTTTISAGITYHFAYTYTLATQQITLYLNGEPIGTFEVGLLPTYTPATIPGNFTGDGFVGSMSKVAGYSVALDRGTISADATEALGLTPGNSRVAQNGIEVVGSNLANARVAQNGIEVVGSNLANARVAQYALEVLGIQQPLLRVGQVALEVLVQGNIPHVYDVNETDTAAHQGDSAVLTSDIVDINITDTATNIPDAPDSASIPTQEISFAQYVLDLLPHPWTSDVAKVAGGVLYSLARALGISISLMNQLIAYVQPQTRIATATDTNLELIATDFLQLPSGLFNRLQVFEGGQFEPESDAAYSARIRAEIIAAENTLAAVQRVVTEYFTSYPDGSTGVNVFDYMSNPTLFTSLGVPRGQAIFVIEIEYPSANGESGLFYLGQDDFVGQTTYVTGGQGLPTPFAPYTLLQQAVDSVRAAGSKVYWLRSYAD